MSNVAILTNFQVINPWYSLTGIVRDQARMLSRHGHKVYVFLSENYKHIDGDLPPGVIACPEVPFANLTDYRGNEQMSNEHWETAKRSKDMLLRRMAELKIDFAFTHDIVFIGWNKPYAMGLQGVGDSVPGVTWLHWIHSIPSGNRPWWDMKLYGNNHYLVYPNKTDRDNVIRRFKAADDHVLTIPHIKDLRVMFNFPESANKIIDKYPKLMQADIVQIYPASTDRLSAKRVALLMNFFSRFKAAGKSVFLFIANQWATHHKHHENISQYYMKGRSQNLIPHQDIIFSSSMEIEGYEFEIGVPSATLMSLMQLANLFIFPTDHETFGLVLPEAILASGALCVINKSLPMQLEVGGKAALSYHFGSYQQQFRVSPEYEERIVKDIIHELDTNTSLSTRTFMRQTYNFDALYHDFYAPTMTRLKEAKS